MTIRIEENNAGRPEILSELNGRAVILPTDHIFMRLSDGHFFVGSAETVAGHRGSLQRLRPHEPEMVKHWLDKTGGSPEPDVFPGEPVG